MKTVWKRLLGQCFYLVDEPGIEDSLEEVVGDSVLYLVDKPGVEDSLEEVVGDSMLYLVDKPGVEDGLEEVVAKHNVAQVERLSASLV